LVFTQESDSLSVMEGKRLLLPLVMAALCLGLWFHTHQRSEKLIEDLAGIESGIPKWDAKTFPVIAAGIESNYAAGLSYLRAHDYEKAVQHACYGGRQVAEPYLRNYPSNAVRPGVMLDIWAERMEMAYRMACTSELDWCIEALKAGLVSVDSVMNLVNYHSDYPELKEKFDEVRQEIEQLRTRAAARWIRLQVLPDSMGKDVEEIARAAFSKKRGNVPGVSLIFGQPLSAEEDRATFKVIEVRLQTEFARYEVEYRGVRAENWMPPQIPEAVTITCNVRSSRVVPTTWDQIPVSSAKAQAPERIKTDEADAVLAEQEKKLLAAIAAQLAVLPEFDVYPGAVVGSLTIIRNGRLDLDAFRALAFKAPEELDRQVAAAARTGELGLQADLVRALVDCGDERYGKWVAQRVAGVDAETRSAVVASLKLNPSYGQYAPILSLIKSATDYPYELVIALNGHLDAPAVKAAILEQIKTGRPQDRANYLNFFLHGVPASDLSHYAAWIHDPDANFAVAAYLGIYNRDQDLASRIAIEQFETASPKVQELMLRHFHFDGEHAREDGLAFLEKVANQKSNPGARREALDKIMEYPSALPEGWDLLQRLCGQETDAATKERMGQKLLANIGRAHPEQAADYYKEIIRTDHGVLREQAVNLLLEMDGPKDERVALAAELISGVEADPQLVRAVLMSVHQYIRIRKGWNFQQAEMMDIVARGVASSDRNVRGFAYGIMVEAIAQGNEDYDRQLTQLLDAEQDAALKLEIAKRQAQAEQMGLGLYVR